MLLLLAKVQLQAQALVVLKKLKKMTNQKIIDLHVVIQIILALQVMNKKNN